MPHVLCRVLPLHDSSTREQSLDLSSKTLMLLTVPSQPNPTGLSICMFLCPPLKSVLATVYQVCLYCFYHQIEVLPTLFFFTQKVFDHPQSITRDQCMKLELSILYWVLRFRSGVKRNYVIKHAEWLVSIVPKISRDPAISCHRSSELVKLLLRFKRRQQSTIK